MSAFRVIEAKPFHCGRIVRSLRRDQTLALQSLGVHSHRALREAFDDSAFRRAWTIDGRLAALGGVRGPRASATGFVWLAMAEEAARFPLAIGREVKKQIAEMMETREELFTSMLTRDPQSLRWVEFLGFEPVGDQSGEVVAFILRRRR